MIVIASDYKDNVGQLTAGDCFEFYDKYFMVTDGGRK